MRVISRTIDSNPVVTRAATPAAEVSHGSHTSRSGLSAARASRHLRSCAPSVRNSAGPGRVDARARMLAHGGLEPMAWYITAA